jgi:hypothetical protein
VPPSCSLNAQYPMPVHVSDPAYSTGPYYAPYQNHPYPYQHGNVNHHYQQSTYERYTFDILMNLSTSCIYIVVFFLFCFVLFLFLFRHCFQFDSSPTTFPRVWLCSFFVICNVLFDDHCP